MGLQRDDDIHLHDTRLNKGQRVHVRDHFGHAGRLDQDDGTRAVFAVPDLAQHIRAVEPPYLAQFGFESVVDDPCEASETMRVPTRNCICVRPLSEGGRQSVRQGAGQQSGNRAEGRTDALGIATLDGQQQETGKHAQGNERHAR